MTKELPSKILYPEIASEILKMRDRDQEMRIRALENNGVIKSEEDDRVDLENTERMKQIIEEIGWPTVSKVGEDVSRAAWLLVQHADHDREFQKSCLQLMRAENSGEVSLKDLALLEDRILVNSGQPQTYGSQFFGQTEETFGPRPIADPENVDSRRAAVGLEPLAEYRKILIEKFFRQK